MGILLAIKMPVIALNPRQAVASVLGIVVTGLGILIFSESLRVSLHTWLHDEQYSFGLLVPPLVGYLLWRRRQEILAVGKSSWLAGLFLVGLGCGLQVLASQGGTLVLSGIAMIVILMGIVGFLWGKRCLAIAAGPIALLLLMVPLPSYVAGEISWNLQVAASTASGAILGFLGVPVYQDGNLLRLPNYVLEVAQACSGSRSIFALLALTCVLALTMKSKLWTRVALVISAPFLAMGANVIRIVGTGLIARKWGTLAANDSLHEAWGVVVFLISVLGILGLQSLLRRRTCENA